MITSRAKKVAIVAVVYCLVSAVVLTLTMYVTEQNKNKFADVRNKNAQAKAMQQLATTIEQTLRLSEADRKELDSFFISERDTIHFITQVEELASRLGVGVETTQLSVIPGKDDVPSRLHIGFEINGDYGHVAQMLFALETLPYHKSIPDVAIKQIDGGSWEGTIAMYVTLQ
jgi:hypothetical protein